MTYVVSVAGEKGGTGKTTTAMSLAAVAAETARVLVVDTDPQGSALWWWHRAGPTPPFQVTGCADPADLPTLLQADYDLVILDTPGSLADQRFIDAVVRSADVVLLPTPPTPLCMAPILRTAAQIRTRHGITCRALLNIIDPRQPLETAHARDRLTAAGIPCLQTTVRRYAAHERAPQDGLVVTQYPVRDRYSRNAVDDYRRLTTELLPAPRSWHPTPSRRGQRPTVPGPRPGQGTPTLPMPATMAGRPRRPHHDTHHLLQSYPQVAGCALCHHYAAELPHLPPWDVVAATLAFHRTLHRIDVTKIASEHFSVAATSGID